ncbi:hypothetical protein M407DRAFT_22500 [Tulasnella calospora MUT 4182]|uniref:Protein kinase domain-containing protein n=1 Tax=Tulasnella calospora MUT 4182 TaxID=1051891 RepID=A0A0C3QL75_9AGAM|nr:hypothetical protein M407DRAFT_22500 [Tulasnella calospora MUT 4182]
MSDPLPKLPESYNHPDRASPQDDERESLEKRLGAIELNDLQSSTDSQQPRRIKLSARHLLERLSRMRLEIAQINFIPHGSQAKGGYAQVVLATLSLDDGSSPVSEKQVAVKKFLFKDSVDDEKFLRAFANELRILDGLDHPHIVKIIGFVEDMKNRTTWLVFPWEANGNVREFLLSGKWELPERVSLIQDVASGVKYLHSRQPAIRHGDLKSLNILVNSDHRAVITDFGSARIQTDAGGFETTSGSRRRQAASTDSDPTEYDGSPEVTFSTANAELTLTGPGWSFRWAAPEVFLNEEEPCLASDMWALGWIAWEVITNNYPFPEAKTNGFIIIKVIQGLLPSLYDDDQLSEIGQLCYVMVRCWKPEPKERLSAAECQSALQWIPSVVPRTGSEGLTQPRSAALLVGLGNMRRLQSRFREALNLLEEGFAIAQSTGDRRVMAFALFLSADCHDWLLDYDEAEKSCSHSLEISASIEHRLGQANALQKLGEIREARWNLAQAEESFHQALDIYTSIGHSLGRANASKGLGEIYKKQLDYAKAVEYFHQSLDVFKSIEDSLGQANTLSRLGEIQQAQSSYVEAEESFNQALHIYTSIGNSLGQANALGGLGEIHRTQSNHAEAEEYFGQALAIYAKIGDDQGRANSLLELGEIFLRQARYSEAKSSLDEAAQVSTQIGYKWAQNRSAELLAEVLEAEKLPTEPRH